MWLIYINQSLSINQHVTLSSFLYCSLIFYHWNGDKSVSLIVCLGAEFLLSLRNAYISEIYQHANVIVPQLYMFRQYISVTEGNRMKLPSSRWRRRGRSLREVFACSCFFATTDLSQNYNRETRRHGTPCTKATDSYLFSFLYNDPRKIRRETTVGKFVPNNGRR